MKGKGKRNADYQVGKVIGEGKWEIRKGRGKEKEGNAWKETRNGQCRRKKKVGKPRRKKNQKTARRRRRQQISLETVLLVNKEETSTLHLLKS